jgi:hypothetical protein
LQSKRDAAEARKRSLASQREAVAYDAMSGDAGAAKSLAHLNCAHRVIATTRSN